MGESQNLWYQYYLRGWYGYNEGFGVFYDRDGGFYQDRGDF